MEPRLLGCSEKRLRKGPVSCGATTGHTLACRGRSAGLPAQPRRMSTLLPAIDLTVYDRGRFEKKLALILDTGPILALLDAGDPDHDRCVSMIEVNGGDLVVPAAVLVEVDYWVLKLLGHEAWRVFVDDVVAGAYRLETLEPEDLARAEELERAYPKLDLGLVDASVIALCERLGERKVATLDRRDFSVVRPNHCEVLELLPA